MATRSTIAVLHSSGKVSQIYCHFDGYLSHLGKILKDCYSSLELAENLVSHGDASSIEPTVELSVFYGRDRGEDVEIETFDNYEMFRLTRRKEEYNYVFKDGSWYVAQEKVKAFREF